MVFLTPELALSVLAGPHVKPRLFMLKKKIEKKNKMYFFIQAASLRIIYV